MNIQEINVDGDSTDNHKLLLVSLMNTSFQLLKKLPQDNK
jgi:hypothetical protein